MLRIVVICCELLLTVVSCCDLLQIVLTCCDWLLTVVSCCDLLQIVLICFLLLFIHLRYVSYHTNIPTQFTQLHPFLISFSLSDPLFSFWLVPIFGQIRLIRFPLGTFLERRCANSWHPCVVLLKLLSNSLKKSFNRKSPSKA
jgi:hypothetical protein